MSIDNRWAVLFPILVSTFPIRVYFWIIHWF